MRVGLDCKNPVFELTTNNFSHIAGGIDATDVFRVGRVGVVAEQQSWTRTQKETRDYSWAWRGLEANAAAGLTVLVDEHAERDAVRVKAVEEILDVAADEGVKAELLLVLDDPLSHGGNDVVVTVSDVDQDFQEAEQNEGK